jgi:hypothetical protein
MLPLRKTITSPASFKISSMKAPETVVKAKDSKKIESKQAGKAPQPKAHRIVENCSLSYLSDHQSKKNTNEAINIKNSK